MSRVPTGVAFLDAVAGHIESGRTSSADRPIRMAEVDPDYYPFDSHPSPPPPARVTFDGEDTLSGKAYALAQGFIPHAGQRVWLVPIGNTYLITGAVNAQTPQGFWQSPDGADSGVELGGGSFFDTTAGLYLETDATILGDLVLADGVVGEWVSYTPTLGTISGTAPTVGNGTLTGYYTRVGKTVIASVRLQFGTTSTFGEAGAAWTVSLPVATATGMTFYGVGNAVCYDQSTVAGRTTAAVWHASTTTVRFNPPGGDITSTFPFTWTNQDQFRFTFVYIGA